MGELTQTFTFEDVMNTWASEIEKNWVNGYRVDMGKTLTTKQQSDLIKEINKCQFVHETFCKKVMLSNSLFKEFHIVKNNYDLDSVHVIELTPKSTYPLDCNSIFIIPLLSEIHITFSDLGIIKTLEPGHVGSLFLDNAVGQITINSLKNKTYICFLLFSGTSKKLKLDDDASNNGELSSDDEQKQVKVNTENSGDEEQEVEEEDENEDEPWEKKDEEDGVEEDNEDEEEDEEV